jgi:hypothetical protein
VKLVSQVGRAKGSRVSQVVATAGNHNTVPNSDAKKHHHYTAEANSGSSSAWENIPVIAERNCTKTYTTGGTNVAAVAVEPK